MGSGGSLTVPQLTVGAGGIVDAGPVAIGTVTNAQPLVVSGNTSTNSLTAGPGPVQFNAPVTVGTGIAIGPGKTVSGTGNIDASGRIACDSAFISGTPLNVGGGLYGSNAEGNNGTANLPLGWYVAPPGTLPSGTAVTAACSSTGVLTAAESVSTAGFFLTGSATNRGGSIYGFDGVATVPDNHPAGLYVGAPNTGSGAGAVNLTSTGQVQAIGFVSKALSVGTTFAANFPLGIQTITETATGGNTLTGFSIGSYFLCWGQGNTASDGGVIYSCPRAGTVVFAGFSTVNGVNVLIERDSGNQFRAVTVSPSGTPAGGGIPVTAFYVVSTPP
jgi:hypothetical protein